MTQKRLEYHREYRKKNREKLRLYNRKYNKSWRAKNGYHNERNSQIRYPEKVKARRLVGFAIKKGYLKVGPCLVENCASTAQAHHPDYSKPFEVIWLCPVHHAEVHRGT